MEFKFTLKHWKIKKNHDLKSGQEVQGLPRLLIGKDSAYQCRRSKRHRLDCIKKIHWERKWQPTPVFLPGKSHHRGVWHSTVHRVSKSQTWLSTQACRKSNDHLLVSISRWLCLCPHLRGRLPLTCHLHPEALRSTKSGTLMYIFCICHFVLNMKDGARHAEIGHIFSSNKCLFSHSLIPPIHIYKVLYVY